MLGGSGGGLEGGRRGRIPWDLEVGVSVEGCYWRRSVEAYRVRDLDLLRPRLGHILWSCLAVELLVLVRSGSMSRLIVSLCGGLRVVRRLLVVVFLELCSLDTLPLCLLSLAPLRRNQS